MIPTRLIYKSHFSILAMHIILQFITEVVNPESQSLHACAHTLTLTHTCAHARKHTSCGKLLMHQ